MVDVGRDRGEEFHAVGRGGAHLDRHGAGEGYALVQVALQDLRSHVAVIAQAIGTSVFIGL